MIPQVYTTVNIALSAQVCTPSLPWRVAHTARLSPQQNPPPDGAEMKQICKSKKPTPSNDPRRRLALADYKSAASNKSKCSCSTHIELQFDFEAQAQSISFLQNLPGH